MSTAYHSRTGGQTETPHLSFRTEPVPRIRGGLAQSDLFRGILYSYTHLSARDQDRANDRQLIDDHFLERIETQKHMMNHGVRRRYCVMVADIRVGQSCGSGLLAEQRLFYAVFASILAQSG